MYCVRFTVVFLLCLPAIGCQTIPEAIPQAEAIVMEHPDSAVRLLRGIPAPAKNLSRRNYARYALILTQARWLAGENLTGDTLSDVALAYYSTHTKDFVRVHKAYYYAAKIADRRHQPEIAMSLLLNSRQALPAAGEWQRHYVVETWLGVFCGKQRLYEEKVGHAMRAYAYADSLDRDGWRCISLGDIAHAYMGLGKYDSMEYYALKALRLAEEKGITENTSQKWAMLIENALRRGDYAAAEEYWERGYEFAPERARFSWIKTKAEIYNKQGRYDVALRLIDSSRMMCPDTSDLTARALWAFHASEAYEGLGQAKKSLEALNIIAASGIRSKTTYTAPMCSTSANCGSTSTSKPGTPPSRGRNSSANASHTGRCWPAARYCCSGHGWGCAYGTGQNCGKSPSKNAS
ncbi:MAG: tetratricopeptide repeat protein [Alistipes sp.]|nr:tetratricopeptide repeat protein [Alistipes sp.]